MGQSNNIVQRGLQWLGRGAKLKTSDDGILPPDDQPFDYVTPSQKALLDSERVSKAMKSFTWGGGLGSFDLNSAYKYADLQTTPMGVAIAVTASVEAAGCISVRSYKVGSMPWEIRTRGGDIVATNQDANPAHPLARAIHSARGDTGNGLFGDWEYWLCIHGEMFVEKLRNEALFPAGLLGLDPLYMSISAPLNIIESYRYNGAGGSVQLSKYDVVYHKYRHPYDPIRGLSPLETALAYVNIDRALSTEVLNYFHRSMRPSAFVAPKGGAQFDEADAAFLREYLMNKVSGSTNAYKPLIAPKEAEITPFPFPEFRDQDALSDRVALKVHKAFRVPRSMTGDADSTRYQANNTEDEWFFENVIKPECESIAEVVNHDLMPFFDQSERFTFGFDYSAYSFVTERDKINSDIATAQYQGGVATRNEAREKVGLEPIEGGDTFAEPQNTPSLLPGQPLSAPAAEVVPPVAPTPAPTPTKDSGKPLFVGLDLGNDPALIELQKRLLQLYPNPTVQWNAPADYHVTLLYAPSVDDAAMQAFTEAIQEYDLPAMALKVGSLHTFDNVGEYALHFQIRRNAALLEFQAALYDLCQELGIATSPYSVPVDYKPHITMAYLPERVSVTTFRGKLTVKPQRFVVKSDDDELYRSDGDPVEDTAAPDDESQADDSAVVDELKAWHKAAKRDTTRAFDVERIDAATAQLIRADLADCERTEKAVKVLFGKWQRVLEARIGTLAVSAADYPEATRVYAECLKSFGVDNPAAVLAHARSIIGMKAISTTQAKFETALVTQFTNAFNEKIRKTVFISRMLVTLTRYSRLAVADGYSDAGSEIDLEDDTDEESIEANKWLDAFIGDQEQYVRNIADVLYADDEITLDEIRGQKPYLWWTGSVLPAYNWALMTASRNARLKWVMNPAKENCHSCITLNGIVLTAKRWKAEGVEPGSRKLACWGGNCGCGFEPTREKKYRGALPKWQKSIEMHEHQHEHAEAMV